jgi:hypothetical protein
MGHPVQNAESISDNRERYYTEAGDNEDICRTTKHPWFAIPLDLATRLRRKVDRPIVGAFILRNL